MAPISGRRLVSSHRQYRLVRSSATAAEFHARALPEVPSCEIWRHDLTSAALVLGSSQSESVLDHDACQALDVDIVRRRSGGGAVLLVPGQVTWIDVIVPSGSAGWSDDVHGPMTWLGRAIADLLEEQLDASTAVTVHEGALWSTSWSSAICFDGVGAGEVLIDGRKLVGISQRRTRQAARLQCCWYSHYDASRLVELLDAQHRPAVADLRPIATVPSLVGDVIVDALADRLSAR